MKKIKGLFLALAVCLLVGCSSKKEVLSPDRFLEIIEGEKLAPGDTTNSYTTFAEKAYVIDSNFYLLYVQGKNQYDIEGVFVDECRNVYNLLSTNATRKTSGGDNWTSLEATDGDNYYYVVWVGDTYIYSKATGDSKDRLKEVIKKLGY